MESIYNPLYLASEAQVEITQSLFTAQHQCHSDQYKVTLIQKGLGCLDMLPLYLSFTTKSFEYK